MPKPTLNYIWVGPPKQQGIHGQDMLGPLSMSKCENPVKFWCLDEHVKDYQKQFAEHKNIEVCSIEQYLKTEFSEEKVSESAVELRKIMAEVLKGADRGSVRDRVTFKDAFAFFILMSQGGYILDTNVTALKSSMDLPSYPGFKIPAFEEKPRADHHVECWMMYCPPGDYLEVHSVFKQYTESLWKAEEVREILGPEEMYHQLLGTAVIRPLFKAINDGAAAYWVADTTQAAKGVVTIDELGIQKSYFGTHKLDKQVSDASEEKKEKVKDERKMQL